jgi:N-acyl-D-aspartate/D-glutamate deacylase
MLDLLLKNGMICDGTAASPFVGDVAIHGGKILEIAPSITAESAETMDVSGLVVAPAFIDMHSHSDAWFRVDSRCEAKLYQGVATEIVGQCGSSCFPRSVSQMSDIRRARDAGKLSRYASYQAASFEKLRRLRTEDDRMSTNLVQMVGHNAIRRGVVGLVRRPAWEDEIKLSRYLLEENLRQGCWGLTLGLGYLPGMFAEAHELKALAKTCYVYDVLLAVHMRDRASGSSRRWTRCWTSPGTPVCGLKSLISSWVQKASGAGQRSFTGAFCAPGTRDSPLRRICIPMTHVPPGFPAGCPNGCWPAEQSRRCAA